MSYFNDLFFGIYPYIAIAVFLIGSWIRFDREAYTWKAGSSQMLSSKGMRLASNLFHVGIIFILMGHVVGLLTPEFIYHSVISTESKQLLAMVSGGFFGIICFVGLFMLLKRRLTDPRIRATSSKSDIFILVLLMVQLVLGLFTIIASTQHMDGSVMVLLATWAQSIVTFQVSQAAEAMQTVGLIYKLHVFVGLTMVLAFPFTRLVHAISAPIWYLGRRFQIVRQR
ncbi:MAG: respiratory nitrate reductase subunit gamma [Piscirickettsiaceae bacterium]|nr:MAG: respiratory nitrate reductase subunit gamma [Piscirickettsiaceae bacterium]PCI71575.1 MAG: respiratory nitrate reductase subunit gamma [Piscirickettsiaceae bacterium]